MSTWFANYGKSLALFAGALVLVIQNVLDGGISGNEWFVLATAVVGGLTTYIVPNLTGGIARYAKALTFGAAIVIGALPAMLPGGITGGEWFDLVILLATQAGVIVLPSVKHPVGGTTP